MNHLLTDRDQKALDAIIAATLRPDMAEDEVSPEEVARYLAEPGELSPEDEAALARLDRSILETARQESGRPARAWMVTEAPGELYTAMNRENDADALDEKSRKEIERQRQRFIEEEKQKAGGEGPNADGAERE